MLSCLATIGIFTDSIYRYGHLAWPINRIQHNRLSENLLKTYFVLVDDTVQIV